MISSIFLAALLALIPPPAGPAASPLPSPSPTPRVLKTIVTVISSPYCNALAQHFNAALVPMVANDRVFDGVDVQLDEMNDMFAHPDYINRYMDLRAKLLKETNVLVMSLRPMRLQIDQLRESAALSSDPQAAQQMRDAAAHLQDAYQHQFQLSTDLENLAREMMEYDVTRGPHPLGGWTPRDNSIPQAEKDIKVYLHFPQQRASIDGAEDRAVDIAYQIAQTHCTK